MSLRIVGEDSAQSLVFDARDYGVVGGISGSQSTAVQAAIDACEAARGGIVLLPEGSIEIGTSLTVQTSNVRVFGRGQGHIHDIGSDDSTTRLVWTGSANGTIMTVAPVEGASNPRISGNEIKGITFDGAGVADYGLVVKSVMDGYFEAYAEEFLSSAFLVGCVDQLGEAEDTQHCIFRLWADQNGSADYGSILRLQANSVPDANPSFNIFYVNGQYRDGVALDLAGSDNNTFLLAKFGRHPSGTAVGVLFRASAAIDTARSNRFLQLSPGAGGVTFQGTETATNAALHNIIYSYDKENGAPNPTFGTGATANWYYRDDNPLGMRGASDDQVTSWYKVLGSPATSTSETLADTSLSFPVEASKTYTFEAHGTYQTAATTTGIKIGVNAPNGAVLRALKSIQTTATANGSDNIATEYLGTVNATTATTGVDSANTNRFWSVSGSIVNGANAGTVAIALGSEVADSQVSLRGGACIVARVTGQHS